jgi:hypothetical protein
LRFLAVLDDRGAFLVQVGGKICRQLTKMPDKDPCWKGYEMVGMKDKKGKPVPNCVPKAKTKTKAKAKAKTKPKNK